MKRTIVLFLTSISFFFASIGISDDKVVIRDRLGRTVATAIKQGNRTNFRDRLGRSIGSATTTNGVTVFRDHLGRTTGTARK